MLYAVILTVLALIVAGLIVVVVVRPELERRRQADVQLAEVERHYQAGVALQDVNDWEAAETEFKQVITLNPSYKDAQRRLADVRTRLAESGATATAEALTQAAQMRAEARSTSTAQAQATATAQVVDATATMNAVETHYQKGLGYMSLRQWLEAKAELEQVFDTDPNYKEVQAKLAEVEAEVAKLTPTATPTSGATPTPTVTPIPPAVTLKPQSAISFQNEGTRTTDDTALVRDKDGFWAPSLTGTVTQDYYANCTGEEYFDALSLQFDIDDHIFQNYRATLRAFVQYGSYGSYAGDPSWNHYLALPGKESPDYEDTYPPNMPSNAQIIDYSTGKWIEVELSPKFWSEGVIWVTLRLWNIRVDAVELVLTPK